MFHPGHCASRGENLFSRRGAWGKSMKNFKLAPLVLAGIVYRPFYRARAFHNSPNLLSRSRSNTACSDTACSAATGATSTESTRARRESGRRQYAYAQ